MRDPVFGSYGNCSIVPALFSNLPFIRIAGLLLASGETQIRRLGHVIQLQSHLLESNRRLPFYFFQLIWLVFRFCSANQYCPMTALCHMKDSVLEAVRSKKQRQPKLAGFRFL